MHIKSPGTTYVHSSYQEFLDRQPPYCKELVKLFRLENISIVDRLLQFSDIAIDLFAY